MVKQTAGRDQLGNFAEKFAQLNDDVLFGEVWSREDLGEWKWFIYLEFKNFKKIKKKIEIKIKM